MTSACGKTKSFHRAGRNSGEVVTKPGPRSHNRTSCQPQRMWPTFRRWNLHAQGDERKRYFLIGLPRARAGTPTEGYGIVVVLPGGPGSADSHSFRQAHLQACSPRGVSRRPTRGYKMDRAPANRLAYEKNSAEEMGFSTEEFVAAVIQDVQSRAKLDGKPHLPRVVVVERARGLRDL